jgi:hypothetical protein
MKSVSDLTPQQLRAAAFDAILRELGPLGLARFVRENGLGSGDYTKERESWLPEDKSVREIAEEWRTRSKQA